jgi:hypothetical protein
MAASTGDKNWKKNWKGSNHSSTVKKSGPYYETKDSNRSAGQLVANTEVTYIDILSESHLKVAIQFSGSDKVYYTNVDNLKKPKSLNLVGLKPQAFNLAGTEYTLTSYITELKNSIDSRSDIIGELREYLLELVSYSETGQGSFSSYDTASLPMNEIRNDFGEVIGPIHCIKRGLSKFRLGVSATTKIFIPTRSNEPLLDYYLINFDGKRIKISAKSKGTSNTLKVTDLVPPVLNDPNLFSKYQNDLEFNIMRTIHENTMLMGPIRACVLLGIIIPEAADSVASKPQSIPYPELFANLILKDTRLKNQKTITTNQVSFLCEKEVINYSKNIIVANKFTSIVKDILTREIYFIKLNIVNGVPNFTEEATSGQQSISNLFFRTKNGYDSKSDKLGFKL